MQPPYFDTIEAYGARFTDEVYWRPYVAEVCARHQLSCVNSVAGLPGTNPVFLVDGRYVVKFYTAFFGGAESFPIERDVYHLIARTDLPAPALIAHGALFPDDAAWTWPYLITTVIPGTSLGEVRPHVTHADEVVTARFLGTTLRRFHQLPLDDAFVLGHTWDRFVTFLRAQRELCVADATNRGFPAHLAAELARYLPSVDALFDVTVSPQLVHADLNADHVLGIARGNHWQPTGIIDFGDALVGDWMYELGALHIGLFRCDKRLLRAFLSSYGFPTMPPDFVRRAMTFTLLHQFNIIARVFNEFPRTRDSATLEALATSLWDLDQPGLESDGV